MTVEVSPPAESRLSERLIGRYGGDLDGPTLIVCGGLHGNEPSGADASERVLAELEETRPTVRGQILFVRGNLAALDARCRYVDLDMNRVWSDARVGVLRVGGDIGHTSEDREQAELLDLLDRAVRAGTGPMTVLDLHTTSSESPPFAIFSDTLENRVLVLALGVPAILGLEERVDGTLLDFATREGHRSFVVEGGGHDAPASRENHVATIWLTMISTGVIDEEHVPRARASREQLKQASSGAPPVSEIRYRHRVTDEGGFTMKPGFRGFDAVTAGQVVGSDGRGDVRAPEAGRLLMPLYQRQGRDGFFVVRSVSPFWLTVSRWLRAVRFDLVLLVLPGVQRDSANSQVIEVDPRIARLFTVRLFHLAGYRGRGRRGRKLLFARRVLGHR